LREVVDGPGHFVAELLNQLIDQFVLR
jgi:hypothetical protein